MKSKLIFLGFLFTAACSGSGSGGYSSTNNGATGTPDPVASAFTIEGKWLGACDEGDGSSVRRLLNLQDGKLVINTTSFLGSDCYAGNTYGTSVAAFNYVSADDPTLGAGYYDVDLSLNYEKITMLVNNSIDLANQNAFCGFTDWAYGVEKDVTGKKCNGVQKPAPGTMTFTILQGQDKELHRGAADATHDGTTAVLRHQSVKGVTYTRQD